MRIDQIDVYYIESPLIYPWGTAYGEDATIDSIMVQLISGQHVDRKETTPLRAPAYSPETAMSIYHTITEFLAPTLVGQEFETADQLLDTCKWIKGNPFAKAGPEIAWWMLKLTCTRRHYITY